MKRIVFFVLCLSFLFMGCSAKNNQITQNELLENIQKTMPKEVYNELKDNGNFKLVDDTYLFANKEQDPTLRLDFTYKDNTLIQYVSKEYGFVESMEDTVISKDEAIDLAKTFAKTFLNKEVTLSETESLSGYEDENYITLKDNENHTYLIQLNKNMVIKFLSDE